MKIPEILRSQGRNCNFAVPPCLFSLGRISHRTPVSPSPVTVASVPHYLPQLSQDQLRNQIAKFDCTGSHQPPALWSALNKANFPSMSFLYGILSTFKHTKKVLSIAFPRLYAFLWVFNKGNNSPTAFFVKKTFDFRKRTVSLCASEQKHPGGHRHHQIGHNTHEVQDRKAEHREEDGTD